MARIRGLGKLYYNLNIESITTDPLQISVLSNLRAQHWSKALRLFPTHNSKNSKKKEDGSKMEGFELETDITVQ